jgi:iron complex outermembrane receptor protein
MRVHLRAVACAVRALCAGGVAVAALPALAQDSPQRVEITGSSIKPTDAETALPVQVITRQEISALGAVNVEQLLQSVSALASSGATASSSASGATTGGLSGISLRGLTSIRTLVLINGRRIAPYGVGFVGDSVSVDVNSIPLTAIERVEVLKDGASAIYGSDAIAGVLNFILRKDYTGLELAADYGDTTRGVVAQHLHAACAAAQRDGRNGGERRWRDAGVHNGADGWLTMALHQGPFGAAAQAIGPFTARRR